MRVDIKGGRTDAAKLHVSVRAVFPALQVYDLRALCRNQRTAILAFCKAGQIADPWHLVTRDYRVGFGL